MIGDRTLYFTLFFYKLENDRFKIYNRCPMTDVAVAIFTDADTDADVAYHDIT